MSNRRLAGLGNALSSAGAALLLVAGGLWALEPTPPGGLRFEPAERVPDDVPTRRDVTVRFAAVNDTDVTVRLVGSSGSCGMHGCIDGVGFPHTVAAGRRVEFGVTFKVSRPGPFEQVLPVFVDHPHLREIPVTVRGAAVAARRSRCGGAAVRRCGGAAVRRCGGAAVRRCGGAAVRRCGGAAVRRCGGAAVRRCGVRVRGARCAVRGARCAVRGAREVVGRAGSLVAAGRRRRR